MIPKNDKFFAYLNGFYPFQYLELRFSKGVRLAACLTFILQMVSYMPTLNAASATIRKSSNIANTKCKRRSNLIF